MSCHGFVMRRLKWVKVNNLKCDISVAGLDPDNAEHLKRALNDIADQLSEQQ